LVFDQVDIEKLNGKPITTNFRKNLRYDYIGGNRLTFATNLTISNLGDAGRAPFTPTISIPDGMRVDVSSTPQINYVWRDGHIEADSTPGAFRQFDGILGPKGSSKRRGVVWLAVISSIILVVAGLTWRRRRARARTT